MSLIGQKAYKFICIENNRNNLENQVIAVLSESSPVCFIYFCLQILETSNYFQIALHFPCP